LFLFINNDWIVAEENVQFSYKEYEFSVGVEEMERSHIILQKLYFLLQLA
jgi:hypothetical protein